MTKAAELRDLAGALDVEGTVFAVDGKSLELVGGRNVQWSGSYADGYPSIWGQSSLKRLRFAPNGANSGIVVEMSATGMDVTGDVTVSGDLVVNGNTVTLNTSTLDVEDKTITVALGSGSAATADGAGLYVDIVGSTNPHLSYDGTNDRWRLNKNTHITEADSTVYSTTSDTRIAGSRLFVQNTDNTTGSITGITLFTGSSSGSAYEIDAVRSSNAYQAALTFKARTGASTYSEFMRIDDTGRVGIAYDHPKALLHIGGANSNIGNETNPAFQIGNDGNYRFGIYTTAEGAVLENKNGDDGITFLGKYAAGGVKVDKFGNLAIGSSFVGSNYTATHALDVDGAIATRQVRHSTKPTLSFDFASTKKLDPRLSFHRNSHATYYDNKGILRYVGQNEPRFDHDPETGESKGLLIETQRTNLNTYSNDMYNGWARASVTVHQNMGVAPDGTHTADLVLANQNSSARHFLYKGQSIINAGVTYTFSVYIKPYNSPTQSFRLGYRVDSDTQGGDRYVTPTVIEDNLPNGWQRVAITVTVGANPSIGLGQMIIGPTNGYTPTKLEGYYVWGYQVEVGDNISSYIPSIQSWNQRASRGTYYDEDGILCNAGEDDPRASYHYDGLKFIDMGILREPESENVWTNSGLESSRGLIAATGSTTRTFFYDTAPDGSQEAVRIQWANGYAYRALSNTLGDSTPWAISFYIKPYSGTARFGFGGTFGSQYWTFNFDTLAVANSAAHANTTLQYGFIRDVGNGWYRVEITFLSTGASGYTEIQWSGTGSADYAIWGVQFEQSKYSATSFIYSGNSTTTRSADIFLASTSNNRADDNVELNFDEYASDKFTFYGEVETRDNNAGRIIALAPSDTDTSNIISLNLESTYFRYYQYTDGALQFNGTSQTYTTNTPLKFAGSWAENDVAYTVNGATPTTATTAPLYTWKHLRIGSMNPGQYHFQGTIKKIAYYDEQLSDSEITALTEND